MGGEGEYGAPTNHFMDMWRARSAQTPPRAPSVLVPVNARRCVAVILSVEGDRVPAPCFL